MATRNLRYKEIISQIPPHLKRYVVDQDYSRYTPIDQATWRFILRQLKSFLSKNAHPCYVDGLSKTGISVDSIPKIEVMCEKLQEFGWTAVPVSGFIPPAAFMEMQSLSLLPIASDMRTIEHILYTPAPDIVHEAAGHAPILTDPDFANYLKEYAQVAKKAIISSEDLAQYEAIRDLSDIKENPDSTPEEIAAAEKHLNDVNNSISHISEAALLGRMNWWTAEYGLIGSLSNPKIFGAGLLSSVGEARGCLSEKVKKVPLSVDCVNTSYDITEQQPQLFVADTFADLTRVLRDLESRLAYKRGGYEGMQTAIKAATVNTVELNSGLQISGKLTEAMTGASGEVIFYKFTGPVQLCENGKELSGHSKDYHAHGFSSPLGNFEEDQLIVGQMNHIKFSSGITVEGTVKSLTHSQTGSLMIVSWDQCTVLNGETVLFAPEWGTFDMAVGSKAVSVFGGPADRAAYGLIDSFVQKVIPRRQFTEKEKLKHTIYQGLRDIREGKSVQTPQTLQNIVDLLDKNFPREWLAYLEVLEISLAVPTLNIFSMPARERLNSIRLEKPVTAPYIDLGLSLAENRL